MGRCKVEVIELIDEVLGFRQGFRRCCCREKNGKVYECVDCKTERVLMMSRSCIVQGAENLDLLKIKLIGGQDAIEDKLQAFLKDSDLGEEGKIPNE